MALKRMGFTLVEILIALFIFTLVALIMTKALHSILATQAATEQVAEQLTETQLALLLLSRDLEQALDRPVYKQDGSLEESFIGSRTSLVLTHSGFANPDGAQQSSSLQRSGYRLENGQLLRDTWIALDQAPHTLPESRVLLKGVKALSFRYLDHKNVFHSFWPPENEPYQSTSKNPAATNAISKAMEALQGSSTKLPRAVEINLTLSHGGQLQQIDLLPQQEVPHELH